MRQFALTLALGMLLVPSSVLGVKEYYGLSRSARSLGMGGAFYGLSDDESALFYNPSSLSLYPGHVQFMVSTTGQLAQSALDARSNLITAIQSGQIATIADTLESFQGKPLYLSAGALPYFVARGFAVGILVGDVKADIALLGRGVDSTADLTAISDTGPFLSIAGTLFNPNLHFGITLKGLYRAGGHKEFSPVDLLSGNNIDLESLGGAGLGIDTDVGMTYVFPSKGSRMAGLSLVLNNLVASDFPILKRGTPPKLVRTASVGSFLQWRFSKMVNYVRFLLDLAEFGLGGESDPDLGARTGSFFKHVNLGVEVPIWNFLYLRTGVHQGNITGGLGISIYAAKLDLATYAEEIANGVGRLTSRRWMVRFALGFGAPSPSSVPGRSRGRK